MRAQLNESERELNEMRRSNERMVEAARAAAAAYCARSLVSRSRDACRRAFSGWFMAACRTEADERIHEVEEGARQHMMAQARTFQARLELLYHEGEQLSVTRT